MTINDLIPYLELHKTMKEDGRETILNNELEIREKEFIGKEISLSGIVSEIDLVANEIIVVYQAVSPEELVLVDNKMISHYYFIFAHSPDLKGLVDTLKMEVDDLVLLSGLIIGLHRNSILRISLSTISITKKNHGPSKLKRKKGCFIATAVYESEGSLQVKKFYLLRDHILARSYGGRIFIRIYYAISPRLAKWVVHQPRVKNFLRKYILDPLLEVFYD